MKRLFLIILILLTAAGFVLAEGTPAEAAGVYPSKPIQLIVPWGAGGRTDINARLFASVAPKYLGQPVVVVNKKGGGSVIGGKFVADADPDGYILLAITPGTNVFPVIFGQAPYDTFDFDPIALKAPQLGFLRWADKAGLKFKHVPVGNDAEAVEVALGGHVDIAMTSSVATIISHVNGGNLNALMVFAEKRDQNLPDAPTAVEIGHDVVASPFTGIAGPKGLSPEVLQKLRTVFKQVIEDADYKKIMKRVGESLDPKFGDDFYAVWKNDKDGYGEIVEKMGLKK
jgi:tripartite-type tricarboxylate transporter receptor subunit TctC